MNLFLDFLNANPAIAIAIVLALVSIIGFPTGIMILIWMGRKLGLGKIYTDMVGALREHTAAEIKIEERISDAVSEIKALVAANWDNRRYIDDKFDHFDTRLDMIEATLLELRKTLQEVKQELAGRYGLD